MWEFFFFGGADFFFFIRLLQILRTVLTELIEAKQHYDLSPIDVKANSNLILL